MTKVWQKVAGMALAGALVLGGSLPALAAENPAGTQVEQKAKPERSPEAKQQHEAAKKLHGEIKQVRENIKAERTDLHQKLQTIKSMVKELKADESKNKQALAKAKAEARELRLMIQAKKELNDRIKAQVQEIKTAREAKDVETAIRGAGHLLSLLHTKLSMLKDLGAQANQVIAHLQGASQGQ